MQKPKMITNGATLDKLDEATLAPVSYNDNTRRGAWISTYTGGRWYPLDPRVEEVNIEDIAHSLSMLCRYNGHCKFFYCLPEDTKILTLNMDWKSLGDCKINDRLLGFEEFPSTEKLKNRRKFIPSTITSMNYTKEQSYRIIFEDGDEIISSDKHLWLCSTKHSGNQTWKTTSQLFKDVNNNRTRWIIKYFDVQNTLSTYDSGYLSGIFDGEGHVSFSRGANNKGGFSIGFFAPHDGVILEYCIKILKENGVEFSLYKNLVSHMFNLVLKGQFTDKVDFLVKFKPKRLLEKIYNNFEYIEAQSKKLQKIVQIEYLGVKELVAVGTSSATFIANGYASHNSVAEHCWLLSYAVPESLRLEALLHDGSEAYTSDIPRPFKYSDSMSVFREVQDKNSAVVYEFAGLIFPESLIVKDFDKRIVRNEGEILLPHCNWFNMLEKIPDIKITGYEPKKMEQLYLDRYYELKK